MYCGEAEILHPIEKQIAWMLMRYGQWNASDSEAVLESVQLAETKFRSEPEGRENEGFETIGIPSWTFLRYCEQ